MLEKMLSIEAQKHQNTKITFTSVGYHPSPPPRVRTRYSHILCKICGPIYLQKDKLGIAPPPPPPPSPNNYSDMYIK